MSYIILNNVSFSYNHLLALENITLSIPKKEFLVLVGANGSGKSTILKIIAGLLEPANGTVSIAGESVSKARTQGKIGYVPQNYNKNILDFPAVVAEIVKLGFVSDNRLTDEAKKVKILEELSETFGLAAIWKRRLSELSGGQQQQVMLARALAGEPEILLLDEPTSGIDYDASEKIYSLLQEINKKLGITIIMVSHDIERATLFAAKVACIRRKLCFFGDNEEFRKRHLLERHFL